MFSLGTGAEHVTSRLQGNGGLCSFDSDWCKVKQSDLEEFHWLWCARALCQAMSLRVGHYQGMVCVKDIVITGRNRRCKVGA